MTRFAKTLTLISLASLGSGAFAADALLDPGAVFRQRKPAAPGDLAAPDGATKPASAAPAEYLSEHPPGYARGMAESVVSTLDGLAAATARLIKEIDDLDAKIKALNDRIWNLRQKKEAEMEDYRNGLFCSGCNQTKTYIDANEGPGHFPHPNQHIIHPTQKQIDDKERELQAPITAAINDRKALEARRDDAMARRKEAIDQIKCGISLWGISTAFEDRLITRDDRAKQARYNAAYATANSGYAKISQELGAAKIRAGEPDKALIASLESDLKFWDISRKKLDADRLEEIRLWRKSCDTLSANASSESDRIAALIAKNRLNAFIPFSSSNLYSSFTYGATGGAGGGELYRFGDFDPRNKGQVLPRVADFIKAFNATPVYGTPEAPKKDLDDALMDKGRSLMRDLLLEENPKPKEPASSGVRG